MKNALFDNTNNIYELWTQSLLREVFSLNDIVILVLVRCQFWILKN